MKTDSPYGTKMAPGPAELKTEPVYEFPVTFAQQRLWFLDQLQPNSSSYNVAWSIHITGQLQVQALERSLSEIVRRHEVLRTIFAEKNGEPVQVVCAFQGVGLPVLDLSSNPDAEAKAQRAALQEAQQPLDLKNGPLFRARLLRLAEAEHVLLLTLHHIIFDGWSRRIFVQELASLYEAFCAGKPSPLSDLPLQYADYAVWQRKHFQGKNLEKQLDYWKTQLADAPPSLALPTDRPRPAVQSFNGAVKAFSLSAALRDHISQLGRRQNATPFMILLAAFQALLARCSGQEDIVVGTPIANRNRAEIENLIGFFANTLVLRTKIPSDLSFADLLLRVKDAALGAYAHQDIPFEKLVEELRPERSLSHNPLFQVLFSLQNAPRKKFELSGLQLKPLEVAGNTAKFDLSLFLVETPEGLRGRMEYNTDLFDEATIARLLEHYQVLLEAAVADPALTVAELPLLSSSERDLLLHDWNSTGFDYPRHLCLHELFEQQVLRNPQAVACVCGEESVTYGELNRRANQIAHFLQQRGVGAGQRVGLFVERSLAMMAGLLGIQKSGAAYVPLDPSYPAERLRLTLDDAQVPVLLTQQSLSSALSSFMPEHGAEVVCLDADWEKIAAHSTTNPKSGATPEDLVYVIFTSGSTGRPKGVQVPHRAVVNLLTFMAQELRMGPADVFPALASFAFDMCIPELYLALVSGGRVIIGDRHLAANGEALAEVLRATGATIVHATPTTWNLLLEAGFTGKGLKRVIGAEALPRELCTRLLEADASLYNFYGPTETTVWSAFHHFRSPEEPIVVGRPLANTQIYILDAQGQPAPIGVPGEIHIGGDGVTCGYLKRPELTAEKFIADPFSSQPGAKMYRTGDLGRYLADGRIAFEGRIDNQVKVRGYRIELGEIETVLGRHAAVQECVVIAREDVPGDKRLVGYVVPAPGQSPNVTELRGWVKERLPEYMTPVAFVMLDRFPLSPNGKVDRRHLPAPDYVRPELGQGYLGPRTPAEEVIAGIWAEVLKLDQVGMADDFFELGGHSLLATQVVSRIRQAFQVELPLRALFEAPTVAGLAERTEALGREKQGLEAPPIARVQRDQALPLSFAQQRLWFLDQLEPNNPLYNVPRTIRLTGTLQADALEKALNEIVRRHETLRTSFTTVNDEPVQVIAPSLAAPLALTDLTSLPESEREEEARRLVMEEAKRPFHLGEASMLRVSLLKLSDDDHVLVLNTHHIISDRWSLGVLSQELATLYEAFLENKPSPLPELPVQYADYAVWQRAFLSGEVLDKQLAYWKRHLAGAPATIDLPTDRPRPPVQTFSGAQATTHLPHTLVDALKELGRKEGVTFFMTMLAAFNVLLSRYCGQDDLVVGSPIAGRNRAEVEKLIGFFVNTLVLRTNLSGNPSFRELLGRVRESAMGAYAHQDLPFEKLVEELKPERDLSRNPLFQVMLILQNVPRVGQTMGELTVGSFSTPSRSSKFDLTLILSEESDGVRATFEYNTDLFDTATVERMLAHLQGVLEAVAADPAQSIAEVPIMTHSERQQVLVEWNATEASYPRDACLPDLFAQQAKQTPDRVAVAFADQQIRFGELHDRSNQLAHYLRKLGVGPEVLVGLFMERSIEMVVGLLGILKAGGAYVPLDPAYPKDRIAFIVEDAKAPLLVTQQSLVESLPRGSSKTVCLDTDWTAVSQESTDDLPGEVAPSNLAYVLYTSGSTGKPKGVQIEHHSLVNFVCSMKNAPGLTVDDTLLAITTLSFDIAGLELYLPLITGAKLVLASREQASDGRQLLDLLNESKATLMQATPATWRMLIEAGWTGTPSLRVLCGGEALPPDLANQLLSRCGQLWNMYGPTETTIWSTLYWVKSPLACVAPIGRPVANTALYILDAQRQPVPIGAAGELYIGGDGVARGYLNRPELTSEKFVTDTFRESDGARLYRTGDVARYLPDGNVQYLGRTDFQVKVRGFRIELGEVESVLAQHSSVQQGVVVVREDAPGDKRLVGYVVPKTGQSPSVSELRAFLKDSLPEYMVPGVFVTLETLPLTPNGKINRQALPAPEPVQTGELVAPQTEIEKAIADIWERVLHVSPIGVQSNFFELGGHSLLATQVVSRIQKELGARLPLRSLFEHPTISQLAKELGMANQHDSGVLESTIPQLPRNVEPAQQSFPLSFAQQRLWVLDRLEPGSAAYNVPISLRLNGTLDVAALEDAINQVIRRHEVLRTEIHSENGEPVQRILPPSHSSLTVVDISGKPPAEREERALRLASEEARKPFDLAHGPLIRTKLLRLSEQDFVLLITVHHISFDGWSAGTFLHEMAAHYQARVRNEESDLPELPIQYADFAAWQRQTLQGAALTQELNYWKQELAGAPASIELPADRPRPPMQSFRGRSRTVVFELPLLQRLKDISQRNGVTPFMTLLAAFDVLLQRYSGQDDLVVGTPIAGRSRPEVEKLIGLFVNTLLFRTDMSGNPSFVELLRRVRKTAMGAYAHQDVPFERLVEELKPDRDLSRNPLFQVMFALQNLPRDEWKLPDLNPVPFRVEGESEKFDLSVTMVERANGLKATFGYNTDLFDEATIIRMIGHFRRLLDAIAANPEQPIADLPLLSDAQEHRLLVEFNQTAADYSRASCVPGLFEAQVQRTPNAVAVVWGDKELTYRHLNERANQIAHYLRKSGVGRDVLVGIYVERSLDMVAGILGILKAGGAYVPLDPAYPKDRIGFILENAQAPVLLTQQSLIETLPEHSAKVIQLDADWQTIARESTANPASLASPEALAYVLYTSGSTGKPKGVQIEHRSLVNFLTSMGKKPGLKTEDILLAVTTLSFDIAGLELYLPLITGAQVVLASRDQAADGKELIALLERSHATVLQATPATWRMLIESGWRGHPQLKILCGGEALPSDLADQLLSRCGELWNMYGPTETTIWSSVYRVTSTLANTAPIGRPIANTTMYVLDAQRRPAPIGVPGELYIGGDGVARGYWQRPELTAEKFLPDPYRPEERIYRTGDLAKYMPDGNIQFLGRADFQVKVRGFRIELEEIEAVLAQHPAVRQGVVIVREDRPGDKRIIGYIVAKTGEDPSTVDLRAHLKGSLPEYMVPSLFVKLASLPLTPNGKINRRALPSPDWSQMETLGSVAARDQLELMLVKIWQKVLGVPNVGVTDNFFDLGGHSLLAARLLSEVEKVAGRQIPLSALFRGATVESLAQVLREGSEANPDPVVMEIQAGNGGLPFFAVASPGVDTLGYASLARHMGSDQPLYKLQAQEPVVERRPFTDDELRELAQEYIAAMRAVQPQGPYCIGGMCEGVQIAERMILELEAQGQKVGLFAIFDTWVLQNSQDPWRWRLYYYQQRLRSLRKGSLSDRLRVYKRAARNKIGQVTGSIAPRSDWHQAYWPENFTPRRFRAPVALFKRPKQPFYYVDDPQMGWGVRSESGVEIHEIDFHHLEILREPYVRILGEKLADCINRVARSNGQSESEVQDPETDGPNATGRTQ